MVLRIKADFPPNLRSFLNTISEVGCGTGEIHTHTHTHTHTHIHTHTHPKASVRPIKPSGYVSFLNMISVSSWC
jgi:hypothetical protein